MTKNKLEWTCITSHYWKDVQLTAASLIYEGSFWRISMPSESSKPIYIVKHTRRVLDINQDVAPFITLTGAKEFCQKEEDRILKREKPVGPILTGYYWTTRSGNKVYVAGQLLSGRFIIERTSHPVEDSSVSSTFDIYTVSETGKVINHLDQSIDDLISPWITEGEFVEC